MKTMLRHSLLVSCAMALGGWPPGVLADGHDSHAQRSDGPATGLIKDVRDATARFRDPAVAMAESYAPFLGCVSGPVVGAMGIHFVNGPLVEDGVLDAARPEILVYDPQENGRLRLVAVEYLVIAAAWDVDHTAAPVLSGQVFNYVSSPNRYGLPPFYELHAWAWKDNPLGAFVDWNPKVSCDDYSPE
ncbi:MAG: hypothetical protein ACREIV_07380 [Planctomycetaceae bacterium]